MQSRTADDPIAPAAGTIGRDDRRPDDPISYWLREPGPTFLAPPRRPTPTADVVIVGGGFTGLWTAIALTDTDPSLRVVVLEAETVVVRRERAERRLLRGVADPRTGQRDPPLPRRAGTPRARGRRQPAGPDRVHPGERHRLRPRGDRHALAGRPAAPGRGVQGVGRRGRRVRRDARVPGPGCGAGRGPLPALARRAVPAARARHPRRPGQAVPRASPGSRPSAASGSTSAPG